MFKEGKLYIDKSWTLFLDRDGVINKKLDGDYVKSIDEFEFLPGVLKALKNLSGRFGKIIIITNQQGIGKGLMSENDLASVHGYMLTKIKQVGGRIDAIYFAPQLQAENHTDRKPGTGMPIRAKQDFPDIDFKKSIVAGDSITDMELGRKLKMVNVLIERHRLDTIDEGFFDFYFESLEEFSNNLM
jgi:histidinol-phosphate phosphatase family protein